MVLKGNSTVWPSATVYPRSATMSVKTFIVKIISRPFNFKKKNHYAQECRELNISFHLLMGEAKTVLPAFVKEHSIGGVVTDFSPLRIPMMWVNQLKDKLPDKVLLCQVSFALSGLEHP